MDGWISRFQGLMMIDDLIQEKMDDLGLGNA
jgi:hypothetical protein